MYKYYDINAEGHSIRCKLYYEDLKKADAAIIYCIGFGGHKDNNAAKVFSEKLLSKSKDVLVIVFEWPAHGEDATKRITLEGCDQYLTLVINELKTKFGIHQIYACGHSFGGYILLKYMSEHIRPFYKVALRSPAIRLYESMTQRIMTEDELEKVMKGKEVKVGFDRKITITKEFLESIKENDLFQRDFMRYADDILIVHGTEDEVIPFADSLEFSNKYLVDLMPIAGADHRFKNPTHMSFANKFVMEYFRL